jgi:hypothetical protein
MHSKNVDSRIEGYDTMLIGSYQPPALDWWTLKTGAAKLPQNIPLPQLLIQHHIPTNIFNSNTENFISHTNKPWKEHYRSYTTDIRWKLFIASEATPSLDLSIIHNTAHMKGAGMGKSAYQLSYRLTVQGSNPRRGKRFFSPQHPDQFWG